MPNTELFYAGYTYREDTEYEDDNCKMMHSVYAHDKYVCCVPFSPYTKVTLSIFSKWIDMGMPCHDKMGGNTLKHHKSYYDKWIDSQIDTLLVQGMTDAL